MEDGSYVLSEYAAPKGYVSTALTHTLWVNGGLVQFAPEGTENPAPYEPVTFVNTKIPGSSGNGPSTASVTVYKKDDSGNPLAGAVLRMTEQTAAGSGRVYEARSNANGEVRFNVKYGSYILSEYAAPEGYNPTDETYRLTVGANGVTLDSEIPGTASVPYKPVTFVNKKIPALAREDHLAYMHGYPGGTFQPDGKMTRAEAVVMFSRLLAQSQSMDLDKDSYYSDVSANAWYANQVGYMRKLGVLADYARDGKFRPDEPVTRAEFAVLAAHFDNLALADSNAFTDVADNHWAVKYINSAAKKGWINGYPDKTFKPEASITRAEVVTLVNRMLERSADEAWLAANANTLPRTYTDLGGHWAYPDVMEASIGHVYRSEGGGEVWTGLRP